MRKILSNLKNQKSQLGYFHSTKNYLAKSLYALVHPPDIMEHVFYDPVRKTNYPVTKEDYKFIEELRKLEVQESCIRDIVATETLKYVKARIQLKKIIGIKGRSLRVTAEKYHAKTLLTNSCYLYAIKNLGLLPFDRP